MRVVIAFIRNMNHELLITQRALEGTYGGYWELPGGKINDNEEPIEALYRELKEELDFYPAAVSYITTIKSQLEFILFEVEYFEEPITMKAGQLAMMWKKIHELDVKQFPPSNGLFFDAWRQYLNSN